MKTVENYKRYKSLLVAVILFRYSEKDYPITVKSILSHLEKDYGIKSDRKSVVRDIKELQRLLELDNKKKASFNLSIEEVEYKDGTKYWAMVRPYDSDKVRLIIECINSAKGISDKEAEEIRKIVYPLASEVQREALDDEVYTFDRVKSTSQILQPLKVISTAIQQYKKVAFNYYTYDCENIQERKPKKKGRKYYVSPYYLLIDNGYYYLIGYENKKFNRMKYRLDRMGNVEMLDQERDGEDEFDEYNFDINGYYREMFGMMDGYEEEITIQFANEGTILDTVIDKFGNDVPYQLERDKKHFKITDVFYVNSQFFSWLCSFGNKAKIVKPKKVAKEFATFIDSIKSNY